jgi:hypothetical protein
MMDHPDAPSESGVEIVPLTRHLLETGQRGFPVSPEVACLSGKFLDPRVP